jgi:alanine dehydrogenase
LSGLLLLTRSDVASLLDLSDTIRVVEAAFRDHAEGRIPLAPGVLGAHLGDGGFHIKTAALAEPHYFAAKINANFPANPERFGLPTIQGLIALFDGARGTPLALMDSIEITILRTAAASAVAARYLARADATTVTICGCGNQGKSHLRAMMQVRPIRRAFAVDAHPDTARWFAEVLAAELAIDVQMLESMAEAVAQSDICVTCTPSRRPILTAAMIRPGMFIAAVGADNPEKQELEPAVLSMSKVVVDLLEQAAVMGDLHHAIAAGAMTASAVHAELGQVVAGQRAGRTSVEEIFVFDSTGTALQDVAAAGLVYERAVETGKGQRWSAAD